MKSLNYEEVKAQIEKLEPPSLKLSILLYRPKNEMNIGHIFRLADAGALAKVWIYQPYAQIKWHKIEKLSRKNSRHIEYEIIQDYNQIPKGHKIALEWTDTSKDVYSLDKLEKETLLIAGNEQKGIPENLLALCDESIHLPMYGLHSSMNMAMATAIAAYTLIHKA